MNPEHTILHLVISPSIFCKYCGVIVGPHTSSVLTWTEEEEMWKNSKENCVKRGAVDEN